MPRLLIAFFYFWLLLLRAPLHAGASTTAIAVLPAMAAGFWYYAIVWSRLSAVAPFGRSSLQSAGNLWLLFMGYSIWLGFFPPTGSKTWSEWGAWILVIAGLLAVLVAASASAYPAS